MKHERVWGAVKSDRGLVIRNRSAFDAWVQRQFGDGEAVRLRVTAVGTKQSDLQRGYYWAEVVPVFADWMGEPDLEAAHEALGFKFLRLENCPKTGAPRRKSTSPREMSHEDFNDYLQKVLAYGRVDCQLQIAEPERDPAKRMTRGTAA